MTALKGRDIDAFLKRPDPSSPIILIYGPDFGLVRERADVLIASAVDDPEDPFSLVRLDGDELASEPSRLVDEAMTVPLFGGRRAIRVRAGARSFADGVKVLLESPPRDCRIVIEGGDMRPNAPLRAMCEKSKNAVAIPCYADRAEDLGRLIEDEMRAGGLRIAPDARAMLIGLLGGDRLASRGEIRKLALYAHGKSEVTTEDVRAVVTDASALEIDSIIDAALAGNVRDTDAHFSRATISGVYPGVIVSGLLRQVSQLHKTRLAMDKGKSLDDAVRGEWPRLHFSRKGAVEAAVRLWSTPGLSELMIRIGEANLDVRRNNAQGALLAHRLLIGVATSARAKR